MSKKTLTDELQSVLLAHSFEAPEPASTIANILAATSAAGAIEGTEAAGTATPGSSQPVARRLAAVARRRPSLAVLVGAAAAVAVLAVGITVVNGQRDGNSTKSTAASGVGSADSSVTAPSSRPLAGQLGQSDVPAAGAAGGSGRPPNSSPTVPLPTITCLAGQFGTVYVGGALTIAATAEKLGISNGFCVTPGGVRAGSEVLVYREAGDSVMPVATLIRPAQQLDVDYLSVSGESVTVTASVHRPQAVLGATRPVASGSVVAITFVTKDNGQTFAVAAPATLVALPCARDDLTVSVNSEGTGGPSRVQFLNASTAPCAIEGYPGVRPQRGSTLLPEALHTMVGSGGGVTKVPAPPIVVLAPGDTASAIIDAADPSAAPCAQPPDRLDISLPATGRVAVLPFAGGACRLQVHPIVAGISGTD
jgi:hypothetical protein